MQRRSLLMLSIALVAGAPALPAVAAPAPVSGFTHVKSFDGVDEYTLDSNGLQVLIATRTGAPVATFQAVYRVGSRNESVGTTGDTHILEHMMFKGSKNFDKAQGTSVDQYLEKTGAGFNATTAYDRTTYFATLPTNYLEGYVAIEADRMRNLMLRPEDLAAEMTVVRNEFERAEDDPGQVLQRETWATAFNAHPYGTPIIGWRSDIEQVTVEKLKLFYDQFYWPNNTSVVFVGDVKPEVALAMVKKYYGAIPRSPNAIPSMTTPETAQLGPRRVTAKRVGDTGIVSINFKGVEATHADFPALSMLGSVLSQGASSRLNMALVEKGLAMSANAGISPMHDASLFSLDAVTLPGVKHETVEKALWAQVRQLQSKGVTQAELDRIMGPMHAQRAFAQDGTSQYAGTLAEGIALGDWTYYLTLDERLKAVKPADVQRVAKQYLVEDQSTTGWFVPQESKQ